MGEYRIEVVVTECEICSGGLSPIGTTLPFQPCAMWGDDLDFEHIKAGRNVYDGGPIVCKACLEKMLAAFPKEDAKR